MVAVKLIEKMEEKDSEPSAGFNDSLRIRTRPRPRQQWHRTRRVKQRNNGGYDNRYRRDRWDSAPYPYPPRRGRGGRGRGGNLGGNRGGGNRGGGYMP
jgi:hypothetical protein